MSGYAALTRPTEWGGLMAKTRRLPPAPRGERQTSADRPRLVAQHRPQVGDSCAGVFLAHRLLGLAVVAFDAFLAHFVDETRRVAGAHFAAGLAALAVADAEAALGAGDAHVHQAAFFLDLVFVDRALVGQQAFFDARYWTATFALDSRRSGND